MTSKRGRKASNHTAQEQPNTKRARATTALTESSAVNPPACTDAVHQKHLQRTERDTDATDTMPPGTDVHVYKEHQTQAIGTRVACGTDSNTGRARGRGRGRGKGQGRRNTPQVTEHNKGVRKRTLRQYQWSTAGRDAFNVAQTTQLNQRHEQSSNGSHGTRFERGEGGGVT